jgi:hypothetical protein
MLSVDTRKMRVVEARLHMGFKTQMACGHYSH